jgi:hypothetical protein
MHPLLLMMFDSANPLLIYLIGANIDATLSKFVFDLNYLKFIIQIIDNHVLKPDEIPPQDIGILIINIILITSYDSYFHFYLIILI